MSEDPFLPALSEMSKTGSSVFGPTPFADYLKRVGIKPSRNTATLLSVDTRARLRPSLREAATMVFRLGSEKGHTGTSFALARPPDGLESFFLDDKVVFGSSTPALFLPDITVRSLFPFQLLPNLSESSMVSLAAASGLFAEALDLDTGATHIPATGQTTYTFQFKPHSKIDIEWAHLAGQVEIDGLFVGKRGGRESLFVVEAKSGQRMGELAKHKLAYPVLGMASSVPQYMEIVPIYLRIIRRSQEILFHIAVCEFPDPRKLTPGIDQLKVREAMIYSLPVKSIGGL